MLKEQLKKVDEEFDEKFYQVGGFFFEVVDKENKIAHHAGLIDIKQFIHEKIKEAVEDASFEYISSL